MNKLISDAIPSADECVECRDGLYTSVVEDYRIGEAKVKDLELRRCNKCGHTILPWASVERVDKVLEKSV